MWHTYPTGNDDSSNNRNKGEVSEPSLPLEGHKVSEKDWWELKVIMILVEGILEMLLDFEKNDDQEYATFCHK